MVFRAIDDGTILGDAAVLEALRDLVAVHLARSTVVYRVHRRGVGEARLPLIENLAERPWVERSFRERHHGLVPAGPEGRRLVVRELVDEQLGVLDGSSFEADRILDLFDQARRLLSGKPVELFRTPDGQQLLISDCPAQSTGPAGIGPLGGTPWDKAASIFMPVGPRTLVAFGPENSDEVLPIEAVEKLNSWQITAADRSVAWHPSAGLHAFVDAVLDSGARSEASA